MRQATQQSKVGIRRACQVLGVPRASLYRHRTTPKLEPTLPPERPVPARSLNQQERTQVLNVLNSERFVDAAPRQVYAQLLDEGTYLCSWRTMYRILDAHKQVRERRDQLVHPIYKKPELLAQAPNQVWSWDITKLRGPAKWSYFYLTFNLVDRSHSAIQSSIASSDRNDRDTGMALAR